jgi:serine/threonine protein kinase
MENEQQIRAAILREANARQANEQKINHNGSVYTFRKGLPKPGREGVVQLAHDGDLNRLCQIKFFFEPTPARLARSKRLVRTALPELNKERGDIFGGAPYRMLTGLEGTCSYAIVMKNVPGETWEFVKDAGYDLAANAGPYPRPEWHTLRTRALWAFNLAAAIRELETRHMQHCDLSLGNIMVTPDGTLSLIDFDAFNHPLEDERSLCVGSRGYASPEVWQRQGAREGSDRVGMAILAQEFLLAGMLDVPVEDAFATSYDQDQQICTRTARCHPVLASKYPDFATLFNATMQATAPGDRPCPSNWMEVLQGIAEGTIKRHCFKKVTVREGAIAMTNPKTVTVMNGTAPYDLETSFGIGAHLRANKDSTYDVLPSVKAELQVRYKGKTYRPFKAGEIIPVESGMVLADRNKGSLKSVTLLAE